MKTVSVNVCNLCVPCENRCRHCLLSWDGRLRGVDYDRSAAFAGRFYDWLKENRPELSFAFYFGYSMDHPRLPETVDFLGKIGSPCGKFLQFDGMKFRGDRQLQELLATLGDHGIETIDLTFYGTREYHDRFAGRKGDFDYMMRILATANQVGLGVNAGVALNHENAGQAKMLISRLSAYDLKHLYCYIPHAEGRGAALNPVRFRQGDFDALEDSVKKYINTGKFRSESRWLREGVFPEPERRVLTLVLTPENVDYFESMDFGRIIAFLEKLDDSYYAEMPSLEDLADRFGDRENECWYSLYDLRLKYERLFQAQKRMKLYDIHDERQCFVRRI